VRNVVPTHVGVYRTGRYGPSGAAPSNGGTATALARCQQVPWASSVSSAATDTVELLGHAVQHGPLHIAAFTSHCLPALPHRFLLALHLSTPPTSAQCLWFYSLQPRIDNVAALHSPTVDSWGAGRRLRSRRNESDDKRSLHGAGPSPRVPSPALGSTVQSLGAKYSVSRQLPGLGLTAVPQDARRAGLRYLCDDSALAAYGQRSGQHRMT